MGQIRALPKVHQALLHASPIVVVAKDLNSTHQPAHDPKDMRFIICFLLGWFTFCALSSADPFRNLDFEDAILNITVPPVSGDNNQGAGPIRDLLPGWNAYGGTSFKPDFTNPDDGFLYYNQRSSGFGESFLTLNKGQPFFFPSLPGFSVLVAPENTFDGATSYWLQQRGDVPRESRSLLADGFGFNLWVDGVKAVQDGSLSVFDVSPYAGKNVEIAFEFYPRPPPPFGAFPTYSGVDNIRFSPQAIPEPGTFALLGLGLCFAFVLSCLYKW